MLVRDIGLYLVEYGLAESVGQDIFLDSRPDKPDNLISIFDTGGYPAELALPNVRRTIQINVRSTQYSDGYGLIWDIFNLLDKPRSRVVKLNGRKAFMKAMQPPFLLDRDTENRVLFVCNFEVTTSRD